MIFDYLKIMFLHLWQIGSFGRLISLFVFILSNRRRRVNRNELLTMECCDDSWEFINKLIWYKIEENIWFSKDNNFQKIQSNFFIIEICWSISRLNSYHHQWLIYPRSEMCMNVMITNQNIIVFEWIQYFNQTFISEIPSW